MVNYREILRMSAEGTHSRRQMESVLQSSHHTINDVLAAAKLAGIEWPLSEEVTNAELREMLFPGKYRAIGIYAEPDYGYMHKELAKPGVRLTLLHSEYQARCIESGQTSYMYTQFCEKYRRWARITKATMRIAHKPGDAMQVDWAGNTLPIYDSVTGEVFKAYLFIAVLPCSCYTYAELCSDMKLENWLLCHVHAYSYFGGVTRLLIPDNLKTGVLSNTRYDTVLNRSYQEMAEHYDTAIVPTRVEHPKDKGHAEGTVKNASTWILAALRERRFFTVFEASAAVAEKLEELNTRPFKKREGNRLSAYNAEERAFMKPLPVTPYEPATWSPELLIGADYLVTDGLNKYSVPFDLIGERVTVRTTQKTLEVYYRGDRIAVHVRKAIAQRDPIVRPEHMTQEHRKYLTYNADDFTVWGQSIGAKTAKVVQTFLTNGKEAEQGFKACASLTKLAERYSPARLERACERLLAYSANPSIRTLSSILKNGQDKLPTPSEPAPIRNIQSHGITRGADYYRHLKGGDHT